MRPEQVRKLKDEYSPKDLRQIEFHKNFVMNFGDIILDCVSKQKNRLSNLSYYEGIDDLYVFHLTKFFPEKGYIFPRMNTVRQTPAGEVKIGSSAVEMLNSYISLARPTIHFTLNHLVEAHSEYKSEHNQYKNIVVISPFNKAKNEIIGGYIEDLMMFGSYRIPDGSYILIPEGLNVDTSQISDGITVFRYRGPVKDAVISFCNQFNIPIMDKSRIVDNPEVEPIFCAKINGKKIISDNLARSQGFLFSNHGDSIFDLIEKVLIKQLILVDAGTECFFELDNECSNSVKLFLNKACESIKNVYVGKVCINSLNLWKNSLISGFEFFALKNNDADIVDEWHNISLSVSEYDKLFLKNKLTYQSSACLDLKRATGLDFKLYSYGNEYDVMLNGICILDDKMANKGQAFAIKLSESFKLPFLYTELSGRSCIVLRDINYPEVGKAIQNKVNSRSK